jgi:hypothetical protein
MEPSLPDIYPNELGDEFYEGLQPIIDQYGDPDQHLWVYLHALALMLKPIDDISKDGPDDEPGWSQLFDLERAKTEWLPWIGQWTGYPVQTRPDGMAFADWDAQERERIITRSAHRRGTIQQLVDVVQEHLSGGQNVIIQERYNNQPYQLRVWVYSNEIATSEAAIMQAINKQKVAGLLLTFGRLDVSPFGSYTILNANSASYTIVKSKFTSYNDLTLDPDRP